MAIGCVSFENEMLDNKFKVALNNIDRWSYKSWIIRTSRYLRHSNATISFDKNALSKKSRKYFSYCFFHQTTNTHTHTSISTSKPSQRIGLLWKVKNWITLFFFFINEKLAMCLVSLEKEKSIQLCPYSIASKKKKKSSTKVNCLTFKRTIISRAS